MINSDTAPQDEVGDIFTASFSRGMTAVGGMIVIARSDLSAVAQRAKAEAVKQT